MVGYCWRVCWEDVRVKCVQHALMGTTETPSKLLSDSSTRPLSVDTKQRHTRVRGTEPSASPGTGCQAGRTEQVPWPGVLSCWWLAEGRACWLPLDSTSESKTPGSPRWSLRMPLNNERSLLCSIEPESREHPHSCHGGRVHQSTDPPVSASDFCVSTLPSSSKDTFVVSTYPDDLALT